MAMLVITRGYNLSDSVFAKTSFAMAPALKAFPDISSTFFETNDSNDRHTDSGSSPVFFSSDANILRLPQIHLPVPMGTELQGSPQTQPSRPRSHLKVDKAS